MSRGVLISARELSATIESEPAVIIDTRDSDAYAEAHIPGAVNLREIFTYLSLSTPEGLTEIRAKFSDQFGSVGLSGKETAIIYEDSMDTGFGQSCRGYFLLKYLGYPKVQVLHGGFQAWLAEGYRVTDKAVPPTPARFPVTNQSDNILIDKYTMLDAITDPSIIKLDVRDVDEWIGTSSSPYGPDFCPRKGRIPGAIWLEWYRMMKPSEYGFMLKSKDEVLAECQATGINPGSTIYIYCFKGARAANTFVALKEAGFENVKIYFGSWNEWSRDFSLPIDEGFPKKTGSPAMMVTGEVAP